MANYAVIIILLEAQIKEINERKQYLLLSAKYYRMRFSNFIFNIIIRKLLNVKLTNIIIFEVFTF